MAQPNDSWYGDGLDEGQLIRRLPAWMKDAAGGIAYFVGKTSSGLYRIEAPLQPMLLDLMDGVCYSAVTGLPMTADAIAQSLALSDM